MNVRAKFKVQSKGEAGDTHQVRLVPVIDGSDENKSFFKYTPGGSIDLQVVNADTAGKFAIGSEFYVDFTPA